MSRSVRTVTVSPPRSGSESTKLAPLPSECACSVPACEPLRDPVTVTVPSDAGGAPQDSSSVDGVEEPPKKPGT